MKSILLPIEIIYHLAATAAALAAGEPHLADHSTDLGWLRETHHLPGLAAIDGQRTGVVGIRAVNARPPVRTGLSLLIHINAAAEPGA
jgi:hypothetical protein